MDINRKIKARHARMLLKEIENLKLIQKLNYGNTYVPVAVLREHLTSKIGPAKGSWKHDQQFRFLLDSLLDTNAFMFQEPWTTDVSKLVDLTKMFDDLGIGVDDRELLIHTSALGNWISQAKLEDDEVNDFVVELVENNLKMHSFGYTRTTIIENAPTVPYRMRHDVPKVEPKIMGTVTSDGVVEMLWRSK